MGGVFRGVGVSPGVAVGRALPWPRRADRTPPREVAAGRSVDDEIARFAEARRLAREELHELRARVMISLGEAYAAILDAQILLADDPALVAGVEGRIRLDRASAGWSLRATVETYLRRFELMEDRYLRERAGDLRDLERRLARLLDEAPEDGAQEPDGPIVVVAHALGPSDTVAIAREGVVGLAADLGGPTSHTAILAQAFGLPAVIGLGGVAERVGGGETIVIDGDRGEVTVDPDETVLADAGRRRLAWARQDDAWAAAGDEPSVTRDGVEIVLRANVEFLEEAAAAMRYGAKGIGLYRSEFLYVARAPALPDEEDHYRTYVELADRAAPHPTVIRTLDLGGEKYFHEVLAGSEPNPVLGLRGLRLCLRRPDLFLPQLRALLRAAAHADIRILLPLVTSAEEVREVRSILAGQAQALRQSGVACRPEVPLGVMVETPAAAMSADLLAREADFLSVGTNDLIQYALAVDRGNPSVSGLYDPLHPAILRMLATIVRSAGVRKVPVALCGEMASDPALVPVLVGLGFRELSCPPRAVPRVREAVAKTDAASSAAEVAELVGDPR